MNESHEGMKMKDGKKDIKENAAKMKAMGVNPESAKKMAEGHAKDCMKAMKSMRDM